MSRHSENATLRSPDCCMGPEFMKESPLRKAPRLAVLLSTAFLAPPMVSAQTFPAKPIRVVTQYVAGSSGDNSLRFVAPFMGASMGQPVVIENRPGAGGVLAAEQVMRAAPDGYSILASNSATHVIRQFLVKNMSFDPAKDFTPITQLTEGTGAIVVSPSFPAANVREMLDYARTNPGKVAFGTSGIGSEHHLTAENLMQLSGVKLLHVPYKAGAQAMLDVSAGQLPMAVGVLGGAQPLVASGKLKLLGVVSARRHAQFPQVATVGEAVPGFVAPSSWTGIFGPAGLPAPLARRISGEFSKAVNDPETREKLLNAGNDPVASTPEQFAESMAKEIALVRRIVQAAGIKPE